MFLLCYYTSGFLLTTDRVVAHAKIQELVHTKAVAKQDEARFLSLLSAVAKQDEAHFLSLLSAEAAGEEFKL